MSDEIRLSNDWLNSVNQNKKDIWSNECQECGLIIFDNFGSEQLFNLVYKEASDLLDQEGERRSLTLAQTGRTPRKYTSVGRDTIYNHKGIIPNIFNSKELVQFFEEITNSKIYPVSYTPEQYIINRQEIAGDTHGWHCDDYEWAFIWIMDASQPGEGGRVEYIPRVKFDNPKPKNSLDSILRIRETRSRWLPPGTAYLMHASDTLHRVTPLSADQKRTVVVMTFASMEDANKTIDHSTMDALYPKDTANALSSKSVKID